MSEDGRELDVTFLPSWLHGMTSKPVDKSWNNLFRICFLVRDLVGGDIFDLEGG